MIFGRKNIYYAALVIFWIINATLQSDGTYNYLQRGDDWPELCKTVSKNSYKQLTCTGYVKFIKTEHIIINLISDILIGNKTKPNWHPSLTWPCSFSTLKISRRLENSALGVSPLKCCDKWRQESKYPDHLVQQRITRFHWSK